MFTVLCIQIAYSLTDLHFIQIGYSACLADGMLLQMPNVDSVAVTAAHPSDCDRFTEMAAWANVK